MAVTSLGTFFAWPGIGGTNSAPAIATDQTIDAAGEYTAWVGVAREAMTVTHVGFRTGTVVSSGAATVGIYTVDAATGLPTTTEYTVTTTGSKVNTGALTSNTWALHTLTDAAVIAAGAVFAVKIIYQGGTSFITQKINNAPPASTANLPYFVTNTSGSDVKARIAGPLMIALGSSSTTFYNVYGLAPTTAVASGAFDNSTAGAKRGMRFQVPVAVRCVGVRWYNTNTTGNYNVILEEGDADGGELSSSSTAITGDATAANTAAFTVAFFDNPVTLSPATWYRAMVEPTEASNVNVSTLTLPSAPYVEAHVASGNCHYTTFTTGGGYTNTDTQMAFMDILIDGIDVATGGGARIIGG
jgi:hypothetical protein